MTRTFKESSVKGKCPVCGKENIVLRVIDEDTEQETAFQYCPDCQWAEDV